MQALRGAAEISSLVRLEAAAWAAGAEEVVQDDKTKCYEKSSFDIVCDSAVLPWSTEY